MGLVLTLFKASVWSLIQTHQDEMEEAEQNGQGEESGYDNSHSTDETITNHRDYAY